MSACPICGGDKCSYKKLPIARNQKGICLFTEEYICEMYKIHFIHDTYMNVQDSTENRRLYNMICYILLNDARYEDAETVYKFYYDSSLPEGYLREYINLAERMSEYPNDVYEKMEKSILNIAALNNEMSSEFHDAWGYAPAVFSDKIGENARRDVQGMFSLLIDLEYLFKISESLFRITSKGWEYIHILKKKNKTIDQGFIAIKFGIETDETSRVIERTIIKSKYRHMRIDQKQYNNQIIPEIFFEIGRSRFVVVDISISNEGAYYEAGYATGLGKEVIVCCKESEFKPHFDIAQKCIVKYKDMQDLEKRLYDRIEATVGIGKYIAPTNV